MKRNISNQIITSLLWGLLLASCGQKQEETAPTEYPTIKMVETDKTLTSTYPATIRGRQDVDILPQVSGTLQRICVTEGERVRSGQTLFIIDQVPYRAALQTAQANVAAARAALATAKLTYESKQELFKENVISEFDLKTAENAMRSAEAQLAQAQAGEVNARNNLSYTEVKSPSDGVVGMLPFKMGALVGPNMPQPLTTVSDNSMMHVYFSMTSNQLLDITRKYGSREKALTNMPEIELRLNDGSMYPVKGKVESISGVVDPSTGTVGLRAAFANAEGHLYSGTNGNVIMTELRSGCLIIPQSATYEVQDKVFAYKVENGSATSVPIKVVAVDGGRDYIVESGLKSGDIIVSEGVGLIREGMPIVVKDQANNNSKPAER